MPFRIDRSVKSWADAILEKKDSNLPKFNQFDLFYLFFWIGLSHGKTAEVVNPVDVSYAYTHKYKSIKEMLAAIVVMSTSKESGFDTKETLTNTINLYMDTNKDTELTAKGEALMMRYVQAGYNHMKQIMSLPQEPDIFVARAYEEIDKGFSKNNEWGLN